MAKEKKPKKDRNLDLSPDLVYKKRALRWSLFVWALVTVVLFAATVAVIQAGPFDLNLAFGVTSEGTSDDVLSVSYGLLGGFTLLWMLLAIIPAVFWYRYLVKRFLPSRQGVQKPVPAAVVV